MSRLEHGQSIGAQGNPSDGATPAARFSPDALAALQAREFVIIDTTRTLKEMKESGERVHLDYATRELFGDTLPRASQIALRADSINRRYKLPGLRKVIAMYGERLREELGVEDVDAAITNGAETAQGLLGYQEQTGEYFTQAKTQTFKTERTRSGEFTRRIFYEISTLQMANLGTLRRVLTAKWTGFTNKGKGYVRLSATTGHDDGRIVLAAAIPSDSLTPKERAQRDKDLGKTK